MALQGTIRDFGLDEIFQLIGLQRKTGVLQLQNGDDAVTIKFVDGQVVDADTKQRGVEQRLGRVLVRTGRITERQLQEALRIQRQRGQRLGHVLVQQRLLAADELVDALRTQSLQIVYRLFRWRSGTYRFQTAEQLEYDERHFTPISADTILMEGARMVDEWPIIERRIRSERVVLRRTPEAAPLHRAVETIVDREIEPALEASAGPGEPEGRQRKLSAEERELLELVDGARSVAEICDRSSLGEFDTWRVLADLVSRHLVGEVRKGTPRGSWRPWRWGGLLLDVCLRAGVAAVVLLALAGLPANRFAPWRFDAPGTPLETLRGHASQARLERVERAIQVYYLDTGSLPATLEPLATGYLSAQDLLDPWGRPYGFELGAAGYRVFGRGPDGAPDPRGMITRRFSGAGRLLRLGVGAEPRPAAGP